MRIENGRPLSEAYAANKGEGKGRGKHKKEHRQIGWRDHTSGSQQQIDASKAGLRNVQNRSDRRWVEQGMPGSGSPDSELTKMLNTRRPGSGSAANTDNSDQQGLPMDNRLIRQTGAIRDARRSKLFDQNSDSS